MDAARAVLPGYLPWTPLLVHAPVFFVLAFLVAWSAARLALVPIRRARAGHWTERARHAYPARIALGLLLLLLPLLAGWWAKRLPGPLFHLRGNALMLLIAGAAWLGAALAGWRCERGLRGSGAGFAGYLRSLVAAYAFFAPSLACVALLLVLMPSRAGWPALLLFAAVASLLAALTWTGGFAVAAWFGLAAPAGERVRAAVERAAALSGQAVPRSWEVPLSVPNALAHVTSQQLAFSPDLVDLLADDELTAVATHELAHLRESRGVVRARVTGVFVLLPLGAANPLIATWGPEPFLLMIAAIWATLAVLGRKSREWEAEADHCSLRVSDPAVYARALERLYEAALNPAVMFGSGGSHPALYDRLTAAGAAPGYPRPAPPARSRIFLAVTVPLAIVTVPLALADALTRRPPSGTPPGLLMASVAYTGGTGDALHLLGHHLFDEREDGDAAVAVFSSAMAMERGPRSALDLVLALESVGRCTDAAQTLAFASDRSGPEDLEGDDFADARAAVEACRDGVRRDRPTGSD
jgi:Zn-dependent protease with chaperone function